MDPTVLFGTIHRSYCTISANFYLYKQYFQQKIFSFSKISGSQTDFWYVFSNLCFLVFIMISCINHPKPRIFRLIAKFGSFDLFVFNWLNWILSFYICLFWISSLPFISFNLMICRKLQNYGSYVLDKICAFLF